MNSNPILKPYVPDAIISRRKLTLLLIVLELGLAVGAAFLISQSEWLLALLVVAGIPLAVLFISYPFLGVILWLLVMPFISVLPDGRILWWAIHRIMIPLMLILGLLSRKLKENKLSAMRFGLLDLGLGILAGLILSSILYQNSSQAALFFSQFSDRILSPFCMFLVVRLLAHSERELRFLQWTALFVGASQALIGIISWLAPQLMPLAWYYLLGQRAAGSLVEPDVYAAVLVFCITILFQATFNSVSGNKRILFLVVCGLCTIGLFLTLERAAWLGGIIVIGGMLFLYPKRMLRLVIVAIIVTISVSSLFLSQLSMALGRINEKSPVNDRIVIFDAMLQMTELKPILGWGYGTLDSNIAYFYRNVGDATISLVNRTYVTSHNTFMTILVEFGIVGFLLYLFPPAWLLVVTFKVYRKMPKEGFKSRSLLGAFWLAVLNYFILANLIDMRFFPFALTLWWMMLGWIASIISPFTIEKSHGL